MTAFAAASAATLAAVTPLWLVSRDASIVDVYWGLGFVQGVEAPRPRAANPC